MPTKTPASRIDTEVAERLEFIARWTKSIRHDLGNVLYPSQNLIAEVAEGGGRGGELAERVGDLMDMVNECRTALTYVRPIEVDHAGGAVVPAEWWRETRHIMKAATNPGTKVDGPTERGVALPVSPQGLTMLTLSVLLAIELQMREPLPELVTITAQSDPIAFVIVARGESATQPQLPAIAHEMAKRLECGLESEWDDGLWRMSAVWATVPA